MTNEQYERWRDFALRMARNCFPQHRRPNSRWIIEVVEDFFDALDESTICCLVDWDHSEPYPKGHPYWHRFGNGLGRWRESPYCVGSMMPEFLDSYRGYAPRCQVCRMYEQDGECRCEEIEDLYYEQWDEQWGGPVRCCIRAGLDCASAPSAGVVGFSAGDVRRMYPEGVPDWVFPPHERLKYWLSDEVNGTFAELPDEAGVVL